MTPGRVPLETVHAVRDSCLCLHTQRAARALARRFDAALRPVGLTQGQFSLMMALSASKPPTLGEVAALLAMDRTTVTAALKALDRRGLVSIGRDKTDGRARRLSLTDAGRARLFDAAEIWRSEHAALEADLESVDPTALRAMLRALA
ncbi:MAG: winged helix-turn-helix transcriptional regulator [Rhizobiales bacterium]|nr:winged helix-turn-helix transcriptional regulator [Hyphomicrobiales bacterium]